MISNELVIFIKYSTSPKKKGNGCSYSTKLCCVDRTYITLKYPMIT